MVRRIARTSASDEVRTQLIELIQSGELPVGARLPTEQELARSFGVSRGVVREGLGTLRSIGLVESRAGAGTFVRSANTARGGLLLAGRYSNDDLHEVRSHLEIPGAALAARHRTPEHLHRLDEIVARHAGAADADAWVRDDLLFHVTLAEAGGNPLQVRLLDELRELQSELSLTMAEIAGGLAAPLEEHVRIVDAVRAKDEDAARAAMTAHLTAIQERFRALET